MLSVEHRGALAQGEGAGADVEGAGIVEDGAVADGGRADAARLAERPGVVEGAAAAGVVVVGDGSVGLVVEGGTGEVVEGRARLQVDVAGARPGRRPGLV